MDKKLVFAGSVPRETFRTCVTVWGYKRLENLKKFVLLVLISSFFFKIVTAGGKIESRK